MIVAFQLFVIVLANRLAFALRFDGDVPAWAAISLLADAAVAAGDPRATFLPFRLYEGLWRYIERSRPARAGLGDFAQFGAVCPVRQSPLGPGSYPRSVFFIDAILLLMSLGGARLRRRVLY